MKTFRKHYRLNKVDRELKSRHISTPLMGERYIYQGKDDDYHTDGNTYNVISVGHHWEKDWGYGIWVSCDDMPNTMDSDYGVFMDLECFYRHFLRV